MKTCHICSTSFPAGLTCPECGAFVVDPVEPELDVTPGASPGDDPPPPGSLGGWVLPSSAPPPASPPEPSASSDAPPTPPPPPADGAMSLTPPPRPAPGEIDLLSALQPEPVDPLAPEASPDGAAGPAPGTPWPPNALVEHRGARGDEPEPDLALPPPPPVAPRPVAHLDDPPSPASTPAPGSLGGWVTPSPAAPRKPAPPPAAPPIGVPTDRRVRETSKPPPPAPPAFDEPAHPRTPMPHLEPAAAAPGDTGDWHIGTTGTKEQPRDTQAGGRGKVDPKLIAGIAAVVVIVVLAAAFFLKPQPTSDPSVVGAVDAGIAGTCYVYKNNRAQIDRIVACTAPHDGRVLGFAPAQSACPTDTTSILTSKSDFAGTDGVLCVTEPG